MDTDWMKHIDWSNEQAHRDFATYLSGIAESFRSADITSRTGHLVDGYVYHDVLNKLRSLQDIFEKPEQWLYARPERNYSPGQGKVNN